MNSIRKKSSDATLTKAIIIDRMNQEIGLPKEDICLIIDEILAEIKTNLVKDGIVKISSFGTLLVHERRERPGNIPKTLQKVIIKARKSVSFKPSKMIKKLIN